MSSLVEQVVKREEKWTSSEQKVVIMWSKGMSGMSTALLASRLVSSACRCSLHCRAQCLVRQIVPQLEKLN